MRRNKYNAQICEADGQRFRSKKERNYYLRLKEMQSNGEILYFWSQVCFRLTGGIKYYVDFMVHYPNGDLRFIDVKGHKTQVYKLKKKLVEAETPYKIEEV